MSVGPKGAKRPLERALDEGAGLSFATVDGKWAIRLLIDRKRPVCTVLTKRRDSCYAASAECSVVFTVVGGKSAATFHGRSSAILLMR